MIDSVKSSTRLKNLGEHFGINFNQLGRGKKAENLFKQGMKNHFDLEKWKEAIAAYEEAIQIEPQFWEAWLLQGIALCQVGRFDRAINSFANVAEIYPNSTATKSALNGQAFAMTQLRRYKEALAVYNKLRQIQLDEEGTFVNRDRLTATCGVK